ASGRGGRPGDEPAAELRAFRRGAQGAPKFYEVRPAPGTPIEFRNTLSKLTAGAGLNTVPTAFYDRLIAHLIQVSGLLQAGVTVPNTECGATVHVARAS